MQVRSNIMAFKVSAVIVVVDRFVGGLGRAFGSEEKSLNVLLEV